MIFGHEEQPDHLLTGHALSAKAFLLKASQTRSSRTSFNLIYFQRFQLFNSMAIDEKRWHAHRYVHAGLRGTSTIKILFLFINKKIISRQPITALFTGGRGEGS